jgi:hypothetical protein
MGHDHGTHEEGKSSVGKIMIDCNFELDSPYYECQELEGGIRVAFIACTYHCG